MRRYPSSIGHSSARASRAGRSRAILAAAIAASLLLPFSGGAAPVASAAPSLPSTSLVRAAESTDGLIHMALIPGESEARYIMSIRTLGQPPKTAACTTRAVTGEIVMNPDGSIIPELSKISLDQRTLKCQAPLSDARAQNLLQTAQHPMAEFSVKSAPGLGAPLPTGDAAFQFLGDQTVRGQTRPATYDTTGTFSPDGVMGKARTTLQMSSFGIIPPSLGPLLQVSDDMIAELDIRAAIAAPVAGTALPAAVPAPATDPAAGEPATEEPASEGEPVAPDAEAP